MAAGHHGPEGPERLDGQRVSAQYFATLGVAPALGRDFRESDDLPGSPPVAILGHGISQRRFGADPAIVGRQVCWMTLPSPSSA